MNFLLFAASLISAITAQVEINVPVPKELEFKNQDTPIIYAVVFFTGVSLILTLIGVCYVFATEDPSKTNIVYKLTYQRMKTD